MSVEEEKTENVDSNYINSNYINYRSRNQSEFDINISLENNNSSLGIPLFLAICVYQKKGTIIFLQKIYIKLLLVLRPWINIIINLI